MARDDLLLGTTIRKSFGGKWFHGQVINIDVDIKTGEFAYHVAYEDGDEEHLQEKEVRTLMVDPIGRGSRATSLATSRRGSHLTSVATSRRGTPLHGPTPRPSSAHIGCENLWQPPPPVPPLWVVLLRSLGPCGAFVVASVAVLCAAWCVCRGWRYIAGTPEEHPLAMSAVEAAAGGLSAIPGGFGGVTGGGVGMAEYIWHLERLREYHGDHRLQADDSYSAIPTAAGLSRPPEVTVVKGDVSGEEGRGQLPDPMRALSSDSVPLSPMPPPPLSPQPSPAPKAEGAPIETEARPSGIDSGFTEHLRCSSGSSESPSCEPTLAEGFEGIVIALVTAASVWSKQIAEQAVDVIRWAWAESSPNAIQTMPYMVAGLVIAGMLLFLAGSVVICRRRRGVRLVGSLGLPISTVDTGDSSEALVGSALPGPPSMDDMAANGEPAGTMDVGRDFVAHTEPVLSSVCDRGLPPMDSSSVTTAADVHAMPQVGAWYVVHVDGEDLVARVISLKHDIGAVSIQCYHPGGMSKGHVTYKKGRSDSIHEASVSDIRAGPFQLNHGRVPIHIEELLGDIPEKFRPPLARSLENELGSSPVAKAPIKNRFLATPPERFRYSRPMATLKDMGFEDTSELREILTRHRGSVSAALQEVLPQVTPTAGY